MRVLIINEVCGHTSTGKICGELAEQYNSEGHEVKIAYGRDSYVPDKYKKYAVRIGNDFQVKLHGIETRIFDNHGLGSVLATKEFLNWVGNYNPDLIWIHNLHGYYINYELLFEWIKQRTNIQIKWTLHDCWAFTGHCTHFSAVRCARWIDGCHDCPQKDRYPRSKICDRSRKNYIQKKHAFTGVNNMTIITPSYWLAKLVKKSFLKDYNIEVHYNTVDNTVFKPTPSDFREKYNIGNKIMLLGVANVWDDRKGFFDFIELSKKLDEKYVIVLVGVNEEQLKSLPNNIIGVRKTNDQYELAGIYTTADWLLSLSVEETFGMSVLEAASCGTKSIVYSDTACEEVARNNDGVIVPYKDIDNVLVYVGKKDM